MIPHLSMDELQAGFTELGLSPLDRGTVELIVARPQDEERQVLQEATLDVTEGLVGDNWLARGSKSRPDGSANPDAQITLMNSRIIGTLAPDRLLWPMAGDQLFVDLDLSEDNLPAGQRLRIGTAIVEVTPLPHTGCAKFTARYGSDAIRFVNSPEGRQARRRGMYVRVIVSGTVRPGDRIEKLSAE